MFKLSVTEQELYDEFKSEHEQCKDNGVIVVSPIYISFKETDLFGQIKMCGCSKCGIEVDITDLRKINLGGNE